MKKIKSPVEVYRKFKNNLTVKVEANRWVVLRDDIAEEIKRIYPFVEIDNATEADLKVAGKKEEKKEVKEEVKEEEKVEEVKEEKPKKSKAKSKK